LVEKLTALSATARKTMGDFPDNGSFSSFSPRPRAGILRTGTLSYNSRDYAAAFAAEVKKRLGSFLLE
jgi:hypothetical protein